MGWICTLHVLLHIAVRTGWLRVRRFGTVVKTLLLFPVVASMLRDRTVPSTTTARPAAVLRAGGTRTRSDVAAHVAAAAVVVVAAATVTTATRAPGIT